MQNGTDDLPRGAIEVLLLGTAAVKTAEELTQLAYTKVWPEVDFASNGSCENEQRKRSQGSSPDRTR